MLKIKQTYCFDDVLLEPQKSSINTRDEVSLSSNIGDCEFSLPIISSPMDTITESEMMYAMAKLNGLGILHRYNLPVAQASVFSSTKMRLEEESHPYAERLSAAIGTTDDYLKRAKLLVSSGIRILCLDVAHGHHTLVETAIKTIKDSFGEDVLVMAGNVATLGAYMDLSSWGADAVRVGIGGGSICSTRIQTGHGIPTLQSIFDCAAEDGAVIVADGGIKNSGDIVKALAAGADFVMLGSMLAGTDATPGEILTTSEDNRYKVYRGMASPEAQVAWRGHAKSLEGVSTTVPYKGPVSDLLEKVKMNVKSGLSYSGARNIRELQAKARFVKQTNAGQTESSTHILKNEK